MSSSRTWVRFYLLCQGSELTIRAKRYYQDVGGWIWTNQNDQSRLVVLQSWTQADMQDGKVLLSEMQIQVC
jgi:hypothetical protein